MPEVESFQLGLLVLARITSFIVIAPFFSIRSAPKVAKIGLAIFITILLFPLVEETQIVSYDLVLYFILIVKEIIVGLIIGFVSSLTFTALRVAGQMVDIQMGFAMASVLDPQTGSRNTLVGQFLYTLGIMLFISINGHHSLLMAIFHSYDLIPVAGVVFTKSIAMEVLRIFIGMFALGFKIAIPFITILLISDIALALLARTVPQLNVFILGFPLKVGLGVLSLALALPILGSIIINILSQMEKDIMVVMERLVQ